MKKQIFIITIMILLRTFCYSQQTFFSEVSIDYTKTVAYWALAKEIWPDWFEQGKDNMPKEITSYFNFTGDSAHSVYKRTKEPDVQRGMWYITFAEENVVYNDYKAGTTTTYKPIYEETFLLQDSLLKIKWKITPDTRTIAGFNCHKAIGIMYDTVAVFAFYTDEIAINGGPEGMQGLPGMILGIGIPRLHATWFATKVRVLDVNMKSVTPAVKGKKTNRASMLATLDKVMKNWDQYGRKMLLGFVL